MKTKVNYKTKSLMCIPKLRRIYLIFIEKQYKLNDECFTHYESFELQ